MSAVDYGDHGRGNEGERSTNPQRTVSPLPLRRNALNRAAEVMQTGNLFQIEEEFINRNQLYASLASIFLHGSPNKLTSQDLMPLTQVPSTEQLVTFLDKSQADEQTSFLFASALFGFYTFQHAARTQAASYGGRPYDVDIETIPTFIRECAGDMREDEVLRDYIARELEDMRTDPNTYSPDEFEDLRSLHPERRPATQYRMRKLRAPERRNLQERLEEWTAQIRGDGTDLQILDLLIDGMQTHIEYIAANKFEDLPLSDAESLRLDATDWANIGFYFGYWTQRHFQEAAELRETWS